MSTEYTPEIADIICARIATGATVAQAIKGIGYPTLNEWYAWLRESDDLKAQYAIAKEDKGATLIDEALTIADECGTEPGEINKARLQIDTRKWIASKFAPKQFGERLDVEHSGGVILEWPLPKHRLEQVLEAEVIESESTTCPALSFEPSTTEVSDGQSSSLIEEQEKPSPA